MNYKRTFSASLLAVVFSLVLVSCNETKVDSSEPSTPASNPTVSTSNGNKIGYVNNDTLLIHFEMFKDLEEEFIQEKLQKQGEFEAQYKQFEKEYMDAQREAQNLSPQAQQILGQKLAQREQELMQVQQQLERQLLESENEKNEASMNTLRAFLDGYAKRHNYDMIYGYNGLGNLLYINKSYDITETVIDSLNAYYISTKPTADAE